MVFPEEFSVGRNELGGNHDEIAADVAVVKLIYSLNTEMLEVGIKCVGIPCGVISRPQLP